MICFFLVYCFFGCVNGVCLGLDMCVCDVRWWGNDCNFSMLYYIFFFLDNNFYSGLVVKLIYLDYFILKF